jgi:hypothetical protein
MTMITDYVSHIIILSIAGLRMSLDVAALPSTVLERMLCDYAPFVLPHSECSQPPATNPAIDLAVKLAVEEGPRFLEPVPGHSWRIDTRQAGGRLIYTSYYEQGWIDLAAGHGRLVLRPKGQPENFLRVAFLHLALAHHGLLLHASGLIRNGRGYVFFGHSGAGKSTIATLAPPGSTLLSDDLVLLRLRNDPFCVTPCQVWLHGVPFRGEALPAPRPNVGAPLVGLYALRQAPSHSLNRLPAALATARLLACTPFVAGDPAAGRQALAVCMGVAKAIPICTLAFARDPGFWQLLTGEEGPQP